MNDKKAKALRRITQAIIQHKGFPQKDLVKFRPDITHIMKTNGEDHTFVVTGTLGHSDNSGRRIYQDLKKITDL